SRGRISWPHAADEHSARPHVGGAEAAKQRGTGRGRSPRMSVETRPTLRIRDLSKTYGAAVRALDHVALEIPPGMFGLLGPNGAGKSTLMRTIATLQDPDEGSIRFGDIDVLRDKPALRRVLGYLPQDFGAYPHLDAIAQLEHFAMLKGIT